MVGCPQTCDDLSKFGVQVDSAGQEHLHIMDREHGGSGRQEHFEATDVPVDFQQRLHVFGGGDVFGNPAAKRKERLSQRFWWKLNEGL